ncbi:MAG: serpin family protein [Candidatus Aenigmatarchaeota archaeon]
MRMISKKYLAVIVAVILIAAFEFSSFGGSLIRESFSGKTEEDIEPPKETLTGQKNFSFELFFEMANSEEYNNLFISPYSIHTALHLAAVGADGETREEMEEVLRLEGEESKVKASELKDWLEGSSRKNEVSIANSMFLRENIPFKDTFVEDGEEYFDAELDELPETGEPINEWVKEKTDGKIEELIDPGPIDPLIIAYLVNAIYFQGVWETEFDEEDTYPGTFYYGDQEVEVDIMKNQANYSYHVGEDFKAVTLEYDSGDYLFNAFVPDRDSSLEDFYEKFDAETYDEVLQKMDEEEIQIHMPKFTLEGDYDLIGHLKALGMEKAFKESEADFSKMVNLEELGYNVFIDEVSHGSFIEVDEEGTEAAGSTAVGTGRESVGPQVPVIELDRPFFFTIEDPETGTILFQGNLEDPSG